MEKKIVRTGGKPNVKRRSVKENANARFNTSISSNLKNPRRTFTGGDNNKERTYIMKLIIKTVERGWRDLREGSYTATSFSIEGRPGEILMTDDLDYPNCHDLHPIEAARLTKGQ